MTNQHALRTETLLEQLTGSKELRALFAPGHVAIGISEEAARTAQGQMIVSFAMNLVARLFPVVQELVIIVPPEINVLARFPRWASPTLDEHIKALLSQIIPPVKWTVAAVPFELPANTVWIGTPPKGPKPAVFIGADGWYAFVSPEEPMKLGTPNPIGAYAAACFAAAELWKRLLLPHKNLFENVPVAPCQRTLAFSTYSYRLGENQPNPPLAETIDIGRVSLVGVGAGGGAAAFTLASLPELRGVLNLIEPDEIEPPNLNRYVFASATDAENKMSKALVAQDLFSHIVGFTARPFVMPFREAKPLLTTADLEYVIAAVHSREARRELQFDTPRILWDAGATEDGEFRIWRLVLGQTECMHCKHPISDDPEQRKAQQLTKLLGLSPEIWRRKIRDNEKFTQDEVNSIQQHRPPDATFDLPKPDQRFGDWEAEQCGRLLLPDLDEEIPLPFAPVLAGVLIAGELIKERYFSDAVLDSYYWNTLLSHFMTRNQPHRRIPRPNCGFCSDPTYLKQYKRFWSQ